MYGVPRRRDFGAMMIRRAADVALGIDNHCAVVFAEAGYRVIAIKERAGTYSVSVSRGRVLERRLPKTAEYLPIETLRGAAGTT